MDFSKFKKLSIGGVELKQLFINGVQVWKSGYKNWVRYSTESDGKTIYNGGLGYKNGYRIRSGGAEGSDKNAACTGFIPVKAGDAVYVSGMPWFTGGSSANALNVSNSSYENIGQFTVGQGARYGIFASSYSSYAASSLVEVKTGVWKWIVPPTASGVAYIRVSGYDNTTGKGAPGARMIVTINEEIT